MLCLVMLIIVMANVTDRGCSDGDCERLEAGVMDNVTEENVVRRERMRDMRMLCGERE